MTVPSLEGVPVDDYAVRLFKEWGIGQAKQDNGVLVLVAPNEREMRIEVGYGLEGILPDGLAGQIIREQFIPRFRDNDYNGGIRDSVARVVDIVEKQQVLTAEELAKFNDQSGADDIPVWIIIPFMALFVSIGFTMVGIGLRSKTGFPLLFGSLFGEMPLLITGVGHARRVRALPLAIGMAISPAWAPANRGATFRRQSGRKRRSGSSGGWVMGRPAQGFIFLHGSSSSFWGGSFRGGESREMVAGAWRCGALGALGALAACSYTPAGRDAHV